MTSYEHKLLFNAMQLNNNDEQTAAVRRELENRSERVKLSTILSKAESVLTCTLKILFSSESVLKVEKIKYMLFYALILSIR